LRYFFHIGYNGTQYNGWQKLPQIVSVQLIVESILSRVIRKSVTIVGCGRTDSHVHASQYFFHADTDELLIPDLLFRLNKSLPGDIAVFDILPMEGLPHARLDAIQRTYHYFIHRYKDPFLGAISSLYLEQDLDFSSMKAATLLLPLYNDYRNFYRIASKPRTTICNVSHAELFADESGDRLKFTISANRFLGGMVRVIVRKLLDVGRRQLSLDEFENYLTLNATPKHLKSAYPQGLYLTKVTYPFLDLPPRTRFDQLVNDSKWRRV